MLAVLENVGKKGTVFVSLFRTDFVLIKSNISALSLTEASRVPITKHTSSCYDQYSRVLLIIDL